MSTPTPYRTGIDATALLDGTEVAISGWSINPSVELSRFANSKTGKKRAKSANYSDATGTINYDWDDDDEPFSAPLSIVPGSILDNVKLLIDGSAGTKFWLLESIIIVGTPQSFQHEGKPALSLNWENNGGTITTPGGVSF